MGFVVPAYEMQNAECKVQNWDLACRSSVAPASHYHVIARRGNAPTWQSPGTMSNTAKQTDERYQEIATGLTALAMTVVVVTQLRRFEQSAKLKFEYGKENARRWPGV